MPWINIPKVEGIASRQAHTDLPADTYERELGKEGFYGPATQMYHRHPPTSWVNVEGQLRPHAFDTKKLAFSGNCPWNAPLLFSNANIQIRFMTLEIDMDHLVRNADGDELLFVHQGAGELFCDYGHLGFSEGDYILLPRGTMWRMNVKQCVSALLVEATNDSYRLPEKGLIGNQAIFDPAILDVPKIDDAFLAQQNEAEWKVVVKKKIN
jgi:homogentisate 1,2-dioxygenase